MRSAYFKTGWLEALAVTVALVSVLIFVTWQLAARPVEQETDELRRDLEFVAGELESVKQRLDQVQARAAVLEREADVLRQANRLLREQESERQAELNTLQSELDFYRRLAGTGGTQAGLDVYRAEIAATPSGLVFRFMLTLTQNIRRASIISGHARIDLEGLLDDRPVTLHWSQLGGDEPEPVFRFKYFQQLEGYLTLPAEFLPTRLVVTLEASGSRNPVQRSYPWDTLLAEPAD